MQPINPCKLRNLVPETQEAVIQILDLLHDELGRDEGTENALIGLEIVLEALGAEGYEFT